VGFIYTTAEQVKKMQGRETITKKWLKKLEEYLIAEVKTYDNYLTGEVYGWSTDKDSCGGYYGDEGMKYAIQEAKSSIDYAIKEENKKKCKQVKAWIKNKVSLNKRIFTIS